MHTVCLMHCYCYEGICPRLKFENYGTDELAAMRPPFDAFVNHMS